MCENLLAEFFSSLFRDICMETYRLCPFSFAHWDIYMKTYSLCPFSFVSRDIYARNSAGKDKKPSPYYKEKGISKTAQREIAEILMREKRNQSHVSGEETVTYKKR